MKSLWLSCTLLLIGCASKSPSDFKAPTSAELAEQIPSHLRSKKRLSDEFDTGEEDKKDFSDPFIEQERQPELQTADGTVLPALPAAEDLIWTDPDAPEQDLGSVEKVFTKPIKNDDWQLSYHSAVRAAYAEGKALMIWFTDSQRSPLCKSLDRQLFGTKEFEEWSKKNVIKLRVDINPKESQRKLFYRKQAYARSLREKFRVKGNPTVLVIGNEGETVGRYTGYRSGSSEYYWGRIKNAVATIDEAHFAWWEKANKKGYRLWTGKNGVQLFAKLKQYKEGKLLVIEPNGRKTIIHEKNVSTKDQKWIQKQKEARKAS